MHALADILPQVYTGPLGTAQVNLQDQLIIDRQQVRPLLDLIPQGGSGAGDPCIRLGRSMLI